MWRLMRKTSRAKMYCALEAPVQDRELGTLYFPICDSRDFVSGAQHRVLHLSHWFFPSA